MYFSKKLKKFKKINHCFFSRRGGFSKGIYKGLNCGQGSKDDKKIIKKNLHFVTRKIKVKKNKIALMYQTHSNKVVVVNTRNKNLIKFKADAIITKIKGLALGVVTADCVPIVLFDVKNHIIGCIHAGWKGALSGVIEKTLKKFKKLNKKNKIYAAIGPCIGEKSYEVDLAFYEKFVSTSKKNKIYFVNKNEDKKLFNLRKYVSDKLKKFNVIIDNINKDTFKEKDNFFSYRRSQKLGQNDYGRCISVITMTKFSQN